MTKANSTSVSSQALFVKMFPVKILVGIGVLLLVASTHAQNATLEKIKNLEMEKIEEGANTQRQIDRVDDERLQLANEYQSALTQISTLEKYNESLRQIILSQQQEKQRLQNQFGQIANLERNIVPMMTDMIDALENFIGLDLPFLLNERTERVADLRNLLTNGKVSNSEKYRRILEAYQVENDYGRTIEAYDATLDGSENGQRVNFLKVGRIAYLYQTPDAAESYRWSPENQQWQMLDPSFDDDIRLGIKMANEQVPSNLFFVPVAAPN